MKLNVIAVPGVDPDPFFQDTDPGAKKGHHPDLQHRFFVDMKGKEREPCSTSTVQRLSLEPSMRHPQVSRKKYLVTHSLCCIVC